MLLNLTTEVLQLIELEHDLPVHLLHTPDLDAILLGSSKSGFFVVIIILLSDFDTQFTLSDLNLRLLFTVLGLHIGIQLS
jgi:hypothetical protein